MLTFSLQTEDACSCQLKSGASSPGALDTVKNGLLSRSATSPLVPPRISGPICCPKSFQPYSIQLWQILVQHNDNGQSPKGKSRELQFKIECCSGSLSVIKLEDFILVDIGGGEPIFNSATLSAYTGTYLGCNCSNAIVKRIRNHVEKLY